jgi:hypothetical protein
LIKLLRQSVHAVQSALWSFPTPRGTLPQAREVERVSLSPFVAIRRPDILVESMSESVPQKPRPAAPAPRRPSVAVQVGKVMVGGGAPIVVQSMTNNDTEDRFCTAGLISELGRAGS